MPKKLAVPNAGIAKKKDILAESNLLKPKNLPEVKKGPRGGRYTEDKTKDGRPDRRYF